VDSDPEAEPAGPRSPVVRLRQVSCKHAQGDTARETANPLGDAPDIPSPSRAKLFLTGVSKMYVCVCNAVSDRTVKRALSEGKHCLRSLREHLGYTARCGRCTGCLREMIDAHLSGLGLPEESAPPEVLREACGG